MSSFNIKSKVIANRDATPSVLTDPILAKGTDNEAIGVEQLPQTADIGSQVRLLSIPSSARLSDLHYFTGVLQTTSLDVAAWYPTAVPQQSSVVAARLISSSAFAVAIAPNDAGAPLTDAMGTIAQQSVVRRSQPLWQSLGLASDPNIDIDLGFTVRTTNSAGAYVGLRARYVR